MRREKGSILSLAGGYLASAGSALSDVSSIRRHGGNIAAVTSARGCSMSQADV